MKRLWAALSWLEIITFSTALIEAVYILLGGLILKLVQAARGK